MKRLEWNRKTASAFAVAAALTIVLAFALSPKEITIAENITLNPIVWTFQRPNDDVLILDKLNSTYADGISVNMYVLILEYFNASQFRDADDYLEISMAINATTSNPDGYIESIHVVAQKDQKSIVEWLETSLKLENLSLVAWAEGDSRSRQAYIKLAGVDHTCSVHAKVLMKWFLLTPETQPHQLEIAYEITYYNGTAYNKIVQPFQLNIIGRE